MERVNFDRIARVYRWLEYATFGTILETCRFHSLRHVGHARRALVVGDGDGRFLARMLTENPNLTADALDGSPRMAKMLRDLAERERVGDRVRTHVVDARDMQIPGGPYDLLVTHFFLDCLTEQECRDLLEKVSPQLMPDARWLISEFAVPPDGWTNFAGRMLVSALYTGFRWITNLQVRRLPDYAAVASGFGFALQYRRKFLGGLLVSEVWQACTPPVIGS
jgi:SAM-dependent methyltransferase